MSDLLPGWDRQKRPAAGEPYGWVQWKGADVCIDINCKCGELSHVDGDFLYYVQCPKCGRTYMVNGHVELVELTEQEKLGCAEIVTGQD